MFQWLQWLQWLQMMMMMMVVVLLLLLLVMVAAIHLTWSGSKDAVLCQGPAVVDQPAGKGAADIMGDLTCKDGLKVEQEVTRELRELR